MAATYESKLIATYIGNLMKHTCRRSDSAEGLLTWLGDVGFQIGCRFDAKDGDEEEVRRGVSHRYSKTRKIVTAENWAAARLAVQRVSSQKSKPAAFDRNLDLLAAHFGLDNIERCMLDLGSRYRSHSPLETLWDDLKHNYLGGKPALIAHLLDVSPAAVETRLTARGRLFRFGLISFSESHYAPIRLPDGLIQALAPPVGTFEAICGRLVGPATSPACSWADFEHLGEERDMVLRLVSGALAKRAKGVNILLYGPPGTGKTEFCKVLAAQVGAVLHAIGENNEYAAEPSREDRLARLRLSQQLLASRSDTMALFDEMEDVLQGMRYGRLMALFGQRPPAGSKVYLNRLLEEAPIPTLWTSNEIDGFDPALLRRLTLAIEIRTPPPSVRERVWKETLGRERLRVDPALSRQLALEFTAPPALAVNAVRAAKLAGGKEKDLRLAMRSVTKAMAGGVEAPPLPKQDAAFSLDLSNTDQKLELLAERLSRSGSDKAVSLCLFGPPGTGKSAFARHIAERMDMPVLHKRASDLISKWLGESEANIAAAFADARAQGAFLIFDEADSLLCDRAGAHRSWEVSQVNEMLTWMESHELPFACTTNLMDRLDNASLRRFTFKIRFGFLDRDQVRRAFTRFFGLSAPARVSGMDMLTPGDFAVVRRRASLLGFSTNPEALADALAQEAAAKPQASKPIGFQISKT
jgi:SpoVK/Ycf46/Vps4 family AAA+-type ATPase